MTSIRGNRKEYRRARKSEKTRIIWIRDESLYDSTNLPYHDLLSAEIAGDLSAEVVAQANSATQH